MTAPIAFSGLNYIGIIASTLVAQFISAMWFGPLFNKQWTAHFGWDVDQIKKYMQTNHTKAVWGCFIEQLISMVVLAGLIHSLHITTAIGAMTLSVIVWIGFMVTTNVNEVLWHGEKIQFFLINQANYLVRTVAMAAVYSWIAL